MQTSHLTASYPPVPEPPCVRATSLWVGYRCGHRHSGVALLLMESIRLFQEVNLGMGQSLD
jgi:hypothetical protein